MDNNGNETIKLSSPEEVLEFILNEGIIEVAPYKSERHGDRITPKMTTLLYNVDGDFELR